jgi:hypothetical protein
MKLGTAIITMSGGINPVSSVSLKPIITTKPIVQIIMMPIMMSVYRILENDLKKMYRIMEVTSTERIRNRFSSFCIF